MTADRAVALELAHPERLTLAALLTMMGDDSSPLVGAVLSDWIDALAAETPRLDVAVTDNLTGAEFAELLAVFTSPLLAARGDRLLASVSQRCGRPVNGARCAAVLHVLMTAVMVRRNETDPAGLRSVLAAHEGH